MNVIHEDKIDGVVFAFVKIDAGYRTGAKILTVIDLNPVVKKMKVEYKDLPMAKKYFEMIEGMMEEIKNVDDFYRSDINLPWTRMEFVARAHAEAWGAINSASATDEWEVLYFGGRSENAARQLCNGLVADLHSEDKHYAGSNLIYGWVADKVQD